MRARDDVAKVVRSGGMALLLIAWAGGSAEAPRRLSQASRPRATFVVAFDLRGDDPDGFTWPHESLPPATYRWLLLAVDRMPRAAPDGVDRFEPLVARLHLQVNGRAPVPFTDRRQQGGAAGWPAAPGGLFRVALDAGRLHLSVRLPRGYRLDTADRVAGLRLYTLAVEPDRELLP